MHSNSRIRPYLDTRIVILLERLRVLQGLSIGKILTILLYQSDTFRELLANYYADDEELNNIFLGLHLNQDISNNTGNQKIGERKYPRGDDKAHILAKKKKCKCWYEGKRQTNCFKWTILHI